MVLRGDEICDEELTELLGVHIGLTIEYLGEVIVVLFSRHSDFKVLDDVTGRGVEEIAVLINALNELDFEILLLLELYKEMRKRCVQFLELGLLCLVSLEEEYPIDLVESAVNFLKDASRDL